MFFDNEVSVKDFEDWIHDNRDIKSISSTLHQDLILVDFEDRNI